MHDAPYFFNPDERNMAAAITRFSLPAKLSQIPSCLKSEFTPKKTSPDNLQPENLKTCNLNPHFFAYGQFPLYLAFVSDNLTRAPLAALQGVPLTKLSTDFPEAIYWLRFYSALSSVATVLMVYLISRQFMNKYYSLIPPILTTFSPGLIQSAHFGTTESLLTFFFLTVIYLSMLLSENLSIKYYLLISISLGLALGSKLTGLFFIFPPILILVIGLLKSSKSKKSKFRAFILGFTFPVKKLFQFCSIGILITFMTLVTFVISSPYNLVEPENFKSAVFGYESDVATGKYEAFYTRQFYKTTPFLFQAEKIFPYSLGWPLFIAGSLGFILIFSRALLAMLQGVPLSYFLLITSFLFYLIPNSILFAKWSRFMTPILPFFAIFAGFFIYILQKFISRKLFLILTSIFLLLALTPGLAFISIYSNEDSRITASKWIYQFIPNNAYVLSETANVVDIPLALPAETLVKAGSTEKSYTVISFDFYHLNERPELESALLDHLIKADYIFVPSRRIFKNHSRQPEKFKLVTKYHQLLFSGALGFEKVAEFSSFPKISLGPVNFEFPDENAEETATVFDHPVIRIYKKVKYLNRNQYINLFENEQVY